MKKLFALLAGLTLLLPSLTAVAASPTFTFYPLEETTEAEKVHPGSTLGRAFLLRNTDKKRTINLTVKKREVDYSNDAQKRRAMPLSWSSFNEGSESVSITLKPAEQREVKVSIKVPKDAQEGRYKLDITSVLDSYDDEEAGGLIKMSAAIGTGTLIEVSKNAPVVNPETEIAGMKWLSDWPIYAILLVVIAGIGFFFKRKE